MKQKKSLCSCKDMPVSGAMTEFCIGHVWLFESLEASELEALVRAAVRKVYAPGEAIFILRCVIWMQIRLKKTRRPAWRRR